MLHPRDLDPQIMINRGVNFCCPTWQATYRARLPPTCLSALLHPTNQRVQNECRGLGLKEWACGGFLRGAPLGATVAMRPSPLLPPPPMHARAALNAACLSSSPSVHATASAMCFRTNITSSDICNQVETLSICTILLSLVKL